METCFEWSDLWSSRIAPYRGGAEREAWVEARFCTLGSPDGAWMFPGSWPPHDDDDRWTWLAFGCGSRSPARWLASRFAERRPESIVLLSSGGTRVLAFEVVPGLEFVHAAEHTLAALREMRASRIRLHALLEPLEPRYLRISRPPLEPRWTRDRAFRGEPTTTLPLSATAKRRDTWLRACAARLSAAIGEQMLAEQRMVSLGAVGALPWAKVTDPDGALVPTLWNKGRLDRLIVADSGLEHLVAIRAERDRYAAYMQKRSAIAEVG